MNKRSVWGARHAIKQAHVAKWALTASRGVCSFSLYAALGAIAAPMAVQAEDAVSSTHAFEIEAQSLSSALVQLALQSNSVISAHSDVVQGLSSAPLAGDYTVDAALRILLARTNLVYEMTPTGASILQAPDVQASQRGVVQLQPIYISGEHTQRSYLDTFTSVGVATEEDIDTYKFREIEDVFSSMANVRSNPSNGGNNGFQIRGLNSDGVTQPGNSAGLISIIVDGVTQSAEGLKRGARGLWDVKQVEVLRGPQSTLQGRNALAGAVVIETNDPTYEYEVGARLLAGSLDQKEGGFFISGPIIDDQLAFRVSGEFQEHTKDITFADAANEPLGEDRYRSLRAKVLLEPSALPDLSVLVSASHVFDQPATNTVDGPNYFDRNYAGAASFTEFRKMKVDNYAAHVTYDLSDTLKVHSISAINNTDLSLKSAPASLVFQRDDSRQDEDFTQDVYLEMTSTGYGLSGVVGLFYGDFQQTIDSSIVAYGTVYQDGIFLRETETKAVYADVRYRFNDWVSLLAGGRYQSDEVHNLIDINSAFGPTYNDGTAEFNVFLPKGGVAFDLTDTQTIALTVSKGYRQGFTEVQAGTLNTINKVDPEFQWTYEAAYRDEQFDGLTFGVNVFYNEYTNQQVAILDPVLNPLTNTLNVAESTSYGAEIEGRYKLNASWQFFGSLGLLKTEFGKFEDASCNGGTCEGNEYPEAPSITAALGGVYRHDNGLFVSANANYTSAYYSLGSINNEAALETESRIITNMRVGYDIGSWSASIYADNLFDKDYFTSIASPTSATLGDGRTVGFELQANF